MPVQRFPTTVPAAWAATVLLLVLGAGAHAGISSVGGAVQEITAPTGTLNSNVLESDTIIYTWFERVVVGPGSLSMDHVGSGTVSSNGSANAQTISPGFAQSYIVHFDQAGTGGATANGSITFDGQILGVWHTASTLGSSDSTFAPSGLTYGSLTSRGYELGSGSNQDRYSISSNGTTLTILNTRSTGNNVDELRVLVSPEPGTGALLGLGLLALGAVRIRRRRAERAEAAAAGGPSEASRRAAPASRGPAPVN